MIEYVIVGILIIIFSSIVTCAPTIIVSRYTDNWIAEKGYKYTDDSLHKKKNRILLILQNIIMFIPPLNIILGLVMALNYYFTTRKEIPILIAIYEMNDDELKNNINTIGLQLKKMHYLSSENYTNDDVWERIQVIKSDCFSPISEKL